jgi:hypothetical protein
MAERSRASTTAPAHATTPARGKQPRERLGALPGAPELELAREVGDAQQRGLDVARDVAGDVGRHDADRVDQEQGGLVGPHHDVVGRLLGEERVRVADGDLEEVTERIGLHDGLGGAEEHRTEGDQVGPVALDHLHDKRPGDHLPQRRRLVERGSGPCRELAAVEQRGRGPRVDRADEQADRAQHGEHTRGDPARTRGHAGVTGARR